MSPLLCTICFKRWMSYNLVFPMSEKVLPALLETCYFYSCTDAYCFWTKQRQGIFKSSNLIYGDYLVIIIWIILSLLILLKDVSFWYILIISLMCYYFSFILLDWIDSLRLLNWPIFNSFFDIT